MVPGRGLALRLMLPEAQEGLVASHTDQGRGEEPRCGQRAQGPLRAPPVLHLLPGAGPPLGLPLRASRLLLCYLSGR